MESRLHLFWELVTTLGPWVLGVAVMALVVALWGRSPWRRRQSRKRAEGGTWIRVTPPPEVAAEGARVFWTAVGDIRRARSDPHWVWQLQADSAGVGIWVWAPESVPPENLMRAVEGAWPKARPERSDPPPVEAPQLPSRRAMAREAVILEDGLHGRAVLAGSRQRTAEQKRNEAHVLRIQDCGRSTACAYVGTL